MQLNDLLIQSFLFEQQNHRELNVKQLTNHFLCKIIINIAIPVPISNPIGPFLLTTTSYAESSLYSSAKTNDKENINKVINTNFIFTQKRKKYDYQKTEAQTFIFETNIFSFSFHFYFLSRRNFYENNIIVENIKIVHINHLWKE